MNPVCTCGEPLVKLVEHVPSGECVVWIHEHPVPHNLCEGAMPVKENQS